MKKIILLASLMLSGISYADNLDLLINKLESSGKLDKALDRAVDRKIKRDKDEREKALEKMKKESESKANNALGATEKDHVLGDRKANFSMIVYEDLECPYCQMFGDTPRRVMESLTGINLVSRSFPLQFHIPVAAKEAVAAECVSFQANDVGYFGFTKEVLKKTQTNGRGLIGGDEELLKIAQNNGVIDVPKFSECIKSQDTLKIVINSIETATKAGVSGTPTIIVKNIEKNKALYISGVLQEAELKKKIEKFMQD